MNEQTFEAENNKQSEFEEYSIEEKMNWCSVRIVFSFEISTSVVGMLFWGLVLD